MSTLQQSARKVNAAMAPILLLLLAVTLAAATSARAEDEEGSAANAAATDANTPQPSKCRHIFADDPFPDTANGAAKDYSILAPYISEVTMRTHFHAHQVAGYVGKLNTWIKNTGGANCPTDEHSLLLHLVRELPAGEHMKRMAAQAYNHALYFAMLRKNKTLIEVRPSADDDDGALYVRVDGSRFDDVNGDGDTAAKVADNIVSLHGRQYYDKSAVFSLEAQKTLVAAIQKSYGSVETFKDQLVERALGHFASGWVWILHDPRTGDIAMSETHDGDVVHDARITDATPHVPLAVLDLWEHAYYLDYRHQRKEYILAWFKAVDWSLVQRRLLHPSADFEVPKSDARLQRADYTYPRFY